MVRRAGRDHEASFYYTDEKMVRDLLSITPIGRDDVVLDDGSGKNKVWFNNLATPNRLECEIEDGCDFYQWNTKVDWIIGNPPFRQNGENQIWKWMDKASQIANKGMAFLINHKVFNTLTPVRLEQLKQRGFCLQQIHIVADKRWFGRYYYLIFTRAESEVFSWNCKSY